MDILNEPYKFRDLKIYSSTEFLADNKKKYRQVFDRSETTYIYAELSFYNKKFDIEDWEVNVGFKCFSLKKGRKEICSMSFDRSVSKFDHIVFIREGWGNKTLGNFWKKGTYYWETYINGVKVGTKYFYVEDTGPTLPNLNPFLRLYSLKLFEGPYEEIPKENRVYYRVFPKDRTRYIYTEIIMENLLPHKEWFCEVFVRYFNGAKELKGQMSKLVKVEKETDTIEILTQMGANLPGNWGEDFYTAEVVFMDQLLATVHFEVSDYEELGVAGSVLPFQMEPHIIEGEEVPEPIGSFEELLEELNKMIGLTEIKNMVREHALYIQFLQLRKEKGFKEEETINIHSVFIGNPGTGKTTVAKMMGKLYKRMGLLTRGHVHEVDRVDLVGEYIGQTAPKVKEAIEKARGGVLFIDEAYALARAQDDTKDFGREVIEILVKEMSEGSKDLAVIVAGYPKEMKYFLQSNPGLKSRFKHHYEFPDYLPQELVQIIDLAASKKTVAFQPDARVMLEEIITKAYRGRDNAFGNARYVYDLVELAKVNLGLRIMKKKPDAATQDMLSDVILEDVAKLNFSKSRNVPHIPIDYRLLDEAMAELNTLIGIRNIKDEISQLVEVVRFHRETGKDVLNKFFLHTVFVGNPGTGKTTVARILTKIYKSLGILERGHMVETDKQGLVAGFVGQTATKTAEKIDEAMGGVLFIDEAYSLTESAKLGQGDFGSEAIQTLLKRMEDHRGAFFVFVAGYPDNMEAFMKANPGLKSRFDKILRFEDYSTEELFEIASIMFSDEGLILSDEAEKYIKEYIRFLYEYRDKYFGNARTVRGIVNEAIKNHTLRLASLDPADRSEEILTLLTYDDVKEFKTDKNLLSLNNKKGIGFRQQG